MAKVDNLGFRFGRKWKEPRRHGGQGGTLRI